MNTDTVSMFYNRWIRYIFCCAPLNFGFFAGSLAWLASLQAQEPASLRINEFMASNSEILLDEDGDSSDWIEIWNVGGQSVELADWHLTDNEEEPEQWGFPAITLAPGEFLLVFASGKDRQGPEGELHSNFQLNAGGEYLALVHSTEEASTVVSSFNPFPRQHSDFSYGFIAEDNSGETGFFENPTPGAANDASSLQGFVADTRFSVDRGFYEDPFEVVVATDTPGAALIYTTDGTPPSVNNGTQVPAPDADTPPELRLTVSSTTLLRVMAVKTGFEPSNIDTQTYIFPEQVLEQSGGGAPFNQSVNWGHAGPDWEMDPEIVNSPISDVRPVPEDLLRIATVSLVMDFDEMFGNNGIYIAGQSVERDTSIEFINPEGDLANPNDAEGFQVDGTVQIVGGSSPQRWKVDKLSMRLKFQPDLEYEAFERPAADRFDTLVLDARLNNVWHYGGGSEPQGQRDRAQYVRDQYAANLQNELGGYAPHGRHVHVFINGIYWGMHTMHERPDDNFAASYLGGDNEDYDSIKHNPGDVLNGSSANYNELHSLAARDMADDGNYEAVRAVLDIDNFIQYMLMNYYVGNQDWAHQNWYASFNRVDPSGRWRFHSWDAEKGLHGTTVNVTGRDDNGGPTALHHNLADNMEYRLRFADLAYHHLRHGVLTPENAARLYREITDPIDLVMRLESARWGDNQRSQPYTRLDWVENRDSLFGLARTEGSPMFNFFNERSEIVLQQFRNQGWLPSVEPPAFNQHGGYVSKDFQLSINAQGGGTIYFTDDGNDPRIPGRGGNVSAISLIDPDAQKRAVLPADDGIESVWMNLDFDDNAWAQGNGGAGYETSSGYQSLLDPSFDYENDVSNNQSETLYMRVEFNASDPGAFDGLELGMRYDDGFVAYLNGVEIARANAPGGPGTIVAWNSNASNSHSDNEATSFQTFDVSGGLSILNAGRNVLAVHGLNVNDSSSDFLIWPILNGTQIEGGSQSGVHPSAQEYAGPVTLENSSTVKARIRRNGEWSALARAEFLVDTVPAAAGNLAVSGIHYRPASVTDAELASGFGNRRDFEFLELANIGEQAVDLSGVRFVAGIDFAFDEDALMTQLPAGRRMSIVANRPAFEARYGQTSLIAGEFRDNTNLDNAGERIAALAADGSVLLDVTYDDQEPWPVEADGDGYALSLLNPESNPDANNPANWTAVRVDEARTEDPLADLVQDWLSLFFTAQELEDPAIASFEADPDFDDMINLLEFFHVTDPSDAQDTGGWLRVSMETVDGEPAAQLYFDKRLETPGLAWSFEASGDLITWQDLETLNSFSETGETAGVETIRVPLAQISQARFFRLAVRVEAPSQN